MGAASGATLEASMVVSAAFTMTSTIALALDVSIVALGIASPLAVLPSFLDFPMVMPTTTNAYVASGGRTAGDYSTSAIKSIARRSTPHNFDRRVLNQLILDLFLPK
jgi:hypothetical protein